MLEQQSWGCEVDSVQKSRDILEKGYEKSWLRRFRRYMWIRHSRHNVLMIIKDRLAQNDMSYLTEEQRSCWLKRCAESLRNNIT